MKKIEKNILEFMPLIDKESLIYIFLTQVKRRGDEVAVVDSCEQISYNELFYRANMFAEKLSRAKYEKGSRIVVMMNKEVDLISAIWGIMMAGHVYVPISDQNPPERICEILTLCDAACLVVGKNCNVNLGDIYVPVISLDFKDTGKKYDETERDEAIKKRWLKCSKDDDQLAYIIFTSGTTGKSKGVCISFENLSNFIQGIVKISFISHSDNIKRVALVASAFFDASIQQIFPSILMGDTLYLVPEELKRDGDELAAYFSNNKIEYTDMTPALFYIWVNSKSFSKYQYYLKTIIIGGEKLNIGVVSDFYNRYTGNMPVLQNAYGPTECCVDSTIYTISPEAISTLESVPIGSALPNTYVYVLDKEQHPVAYGEKGELYIGGKGVGKGYWKDEAATLERFVRSPFNSEEVLYKTGDIVEVLEDDNLLFVQRNDLQVKIRGYRIEMSEIETVLQQLPEVQKALLVPIEEQDTCLLAAYLLTRKSCTIDIGAIRRHVADKLPEYMIPAFFIPVTNIPLTGNGKIDIKRLPEPRKFYEDCYKKEEELNEIESVVKEIFITILRISNIKKDVSFFELGGHSLSAIRLMSKINEQFMVHMKIKDIFNNSSIQEMAALIRKQKDEEQENALNNEVISREEREVKEYPQSIMQQRLYIDDTVRYNNCSNNISEAIDLFGPIDYTRLTATLNQIAERHEILRTRFYRKDGLLFQEVSECQNLELQVIELTNSDNSEQEIDALLNSLNGPYDLSKLPLFRMKLLKLNNVHHVLLINIHHIIFDAQSMQILLHDFEAFYNGVCLDPLLIQYKDYSYKQIESMTPQKTEVLKNYWSKKLENVTEALNLPVDYAYSNLREGNMISIVLTDVLYEKIVQVSKQEKCTNYILLLSGFAILIYKLTQQENIVIGTMTTGRNNSELEKLIGVFVNTVPLVMHVDNKDRISELIARVKGDVMEAIQYQEYPYMDMVKDQKIKRLPNRNPIFDVSFNFIYGVSSVLVKNDILMEIRSHHTNDTVGDLHVQVTSLEHKILVQFFYNTKLFKEATVQDLINKYKRIIQQMDGNKLVKEITMVDVTYKENIINRLRKEL